MSEKSTPKMNTDFIQKIDGKDFIKYGGLVDLAHQRGPFTIELDLVQFPTKENGETAVCKATLTAPNGWHLEDYGDASPASVNKGIARHLIRMAATRAKARVLRDYTNVGMTAAEELGDGDETAPRAPQDARTPSSAGKAPRPGGETAEALEQLRGWLLEMAYGDETGAENLLEEFTTFEGREGKTVAGVRSVDELVTRVNKQGSPARFWKAFYSVRDEHYPEWKQAQGDPMGDEPNYDDDIPF